MKIGNNIVLMSETIFIPDGENVEFQYQIAPDDSLNCRFQITQDIADPQCGIKPFMKVDHKDDVFILEFCNFTQSLGATTTPITFALSNKKEEINLIAGVYKLEGMTKIEFQITLQVLP